MNINIKIGTLGFVQIVLIALKLSSVINWSWWVVLIPFILYVIVNGFALILIGLLASKPKPVRQAMGESKWAQKLAELQKEQSIKLNKN